MTKEEKIKEAYGEYWELFSYKEQDLILKNNGWVNKFNHPLHFEMVNFYEIETLAYGVGTSWRPKSLQGIENNNGWIQIESENDLPKTFCSCWVKVGEVVINVPLYYHPINKTFTDNLITQEWNHFTHYQPINQPK